MTLALLITLTNLPIKEAGDKVQNSPKIDTRQLDSRAKVLTDYFALYNSPLEYHAQDVVDAADQYQLDWKLIPAISGVESTFGKFTPGGYNAWGWGVYGNQAVWFKSWKEGIFIVTEGLKQNYIDQGLTNPYSMNQSYAASPFWGWKVTYFMTDLDNFAKNYQDLTSPKFLPLPKIAASSALLVNMAN